MASSTEQKAFVQSGYSHHQLPEMTSEKQKQKTTTRNQLSTFLQITSEIHKRGVDTLLIY